MTVMPWALDKLSEKTLELNFASQLNHRCGGKLLWFGLTQQQEAKAGYDIATRIGQALFVIQMKASNHLLKTDERQFKVPHEQMESMLKMTFGGAPFPSRSVFYAFPILGNTQELAHYPDVLGNTWLCDVAGLKTLTVPTTKTGSPRKDGCHYVNVSPGKPPIVKSATSGKAVFHSEPVTVITQRGDAFASDLTELTLGSGLLEVMTNNNFRDFWKLCELFRRKAFGVVFVK
jgi:hypothetical protein